MNENPCLSRERSFLREVGELDQGMHEVKQATWTIPDFSSLSTDEGSVYSSRYFHFGIHTQRFAIRPSVPHFEREYVCLYLPNIPFVVRHRFQCELSFKWPDGSVGTMADDERLATQRFGMDYKKFFPRDELLRRLAPTDTLILVFKLIWGVPVDMEPPECSGTFMEIGKFLEDFRDLWADKDSCDATLVVRGKEFQVHKCVLAARSPVFADIFRPDTDTLDIPDCDEGTFGAFLDYLYLGRAEVPSTFSGALELYRTAQKYKVPELSSFCAKCLARDLTVQGFTDALASADQYDDRELALAVQDFFNEHYIQIVMSEKWRPLIKHNFRLANKLIVGFSCYVSTLHYQVPNNDTN